MVVSVGPKAQSDDERGRSADGRQFVSLYDTFETI